MIKLAGTVACIPFYSKAFSLLRFFLYGQLEKEGAVCLSVALYQYKVHVCLHVSVHVRVAVSSLLTESCVRPPTHVLYYEGKERSVFIGVLCP